MILLARECQQYINKVNLADKQLLEILNKHSKSISAFLDNAEILKESMEPVELKDEFVDSINLLSCRACGVNINNSLCYNFTKTTFNFTAPDWEITQSLFGACQK